SRFALLMRRKWSNVSAKNTKLFSQQQLKRGKKHVKLVFFPLFVLEFKNNAYICSDKYNYRIS
ncbi:MAG: hypothetical protein IKO08_00005, partial [Bacteroidales bacterium]|nr:hypothetical protein [Bacteroidales bacterium]